MFSILPQIGALSCGLLAASAGAQQLLHTVDNGGYAYDLSTAPSLAVNDSVLVVAGSHQLLLLDKGIPVSSLLPSPVAYGPTLPDPGFPFVPVSTATPPILYPSFVFPRADFDPYTRRIWMAYMERGPVLAGDESPELRVTCDAFFHLAIQKDLATNPQTDFSTSQWWYYSGDAATAPQGPTRSAFDLSLNDFPTGLTPFRDDDVLFPQFDHDAPTSLRMPSIAFDETHVAVAVTDTLDCGAPFTGNGLNGGEQCIIIIPRNHSGGSTVDGDRPAESAMVVARMQSRGLVVDESYNGLAVQEPYQQYDNIMLFISTEGSDLLGVPQQNVRLKALFWDDVDQEWEIRQQLQLSPGGTLFLQDIGLPFGYRYRIDSQTPQTDNAATPSFEPTVEGEFFTSAVLTKDNMGNDRVFAVHAVKPVDSVQGPEGFYRVQWYVIDPKLDDIIAPDVLDTSWQPELIASGIIDETDDATEQVQGHCYHPVIGVTPTGKAFIEYTFSSLSEPQRIIRAELNSTYTDTVSQVPIQTGSGLEYNGAPFADRWALYADMQADPNPSPFQCRWLWSTHTLANDVVTSLPNQTDRRDIWLLRQLFSPCFQTDLNMSGFTDPYDLLLYQNYFMAGDERADTNDDQHVDAIDMINFVDAYDAATGP